MASSMGKTMLGEPFSELTAVAIAEEIPTDAAPSTTIGAGATTFRYQPRSNHAPPPPVESMAGDCHGEDVGSRPAAPDDDGRDPRDDSIRFGSANDIVTGKVFHRSESLEDSRNRNHVRGVSTLADDGSATAASSKGSRSSASSTLSRTFRYRPVGWLDERDRSASQRSAATANTFDYSTGSVTWSNGSSVASSTFSYRSGGSTKKSALKKSSYNEPPSPSASAKSAPVAAVVAGEKSTGLRTRQLTAVSRNYDLDGDGILDPIEQAMRDRDLDGDGQLDHAEVYRIVQDQLRLEQDFGMYRKVAASLLFLVAILALSNFGTSWATAILTKEVSADSDTATILDKATQEVMGYQQVAHSIEMQELTNDEFRERRRLVDEALMEDVDHGDHAHRRLGKKKDNFCTCTQIAYDHNKIDERDLEGLVKKCDGANTVNMRRRWRNRDGTSDKDYDTICGPGTVVVRKQKKKKNKNKTKTKLIDERVTFRKKGRNGEDKSINFDCDGKGSCYTSGETLLQGLGHPCNPWRDLNRASECESGLVCHDPADTGSGSCVELQRYSHKDQVCNVDYGVDACVSGYSCKSSRKGKKQQRFELQVNVGTCTEVKTKSSNLEVCNASFMENACDTGYVCLGSNGKDLHGRGVGYCTRLARAQRSGGSCDLSYGSNACDRGMYCQDGRTARSGGAQAAGGAGGPTHGGYSGTSAVISGPSGTVVAGNSHGGGAAAGVSARSSPLGTGTCVRARSVGATCGGHEECGAGRSCVGLGVATGNGGVIKGSSGTIVYGDGGVATSGYCG